MRCQPLSNPGRSSQCLSARDRPKRCLVTSSSSPPASTECLRGSCQSLLFEVTKDCSRCRSVCRTSAVAAGLNRPSWVPGSSLHGTTSDHQVKCFRISLLISIYSSLYPYYKRETVQASWETAVDTSGFLHRKYNCQQRLRP